MNSMESSEEKIIVFKLTSFDKFSIINFCLKVNIIQSNYSEELPRYVLCSDENKILGQIVLIELVFKKN